MGADIHYAIEARHHHTWHTLYMSSLYWTRWWEHHHPLGPGTSLLRSITGRDYALFGLLSGVRATNAFDGTIGSNMGIIGGAGFPVDAARATERNIGPDSWLHSQGTLLAADIPHLARQLRTAKTTNDAQHEQREAGLAFLNNAKDLIRLFTGHAGTPGLVGRPFQTDLEGAAYLDPTADPFAGGSAHEVLSMMQALQSGAGFSDQDARLIIAYDS